MTRQGETSHFTRLTIGSLFSGIGGLELGLERAGLGPVLWQVEIDPFCRAVLAHHWPKATRYNDVREVGAELAPVEVICGGFPCQDISDAGRRVGIGGERSGLWSEYARIVGLVRPRFVVVENVAALLIRGVERVLGDLAALGYDAEWRVLRASDVGAPHRRERIFILAHANVDRREGERIGSVLDGKRPPQRDDADGRGGAPMADADAAQRREDAAGRVELHGHRAGREEAPGRPGLLGAQLADANSLGRHEGRRGDVEAGGFAEPVDDCGAWPPGPDDLLAWAAVPALSQPSFCRLADGLPEDMVRSRRGSLKAYGNAVVPAVAEVVGRRVMEIAHAA